MKRAICLALTAAFSFPAHADAQTPAEPAAQAAAQTPDAPTIQARQPRKKAKRPAPRCSIDQESTNPCGPPATPKHVQLNVARARADDAGTKLIFGEAPKYPLPFENDLSPVKKTPVGGVVGVEVPF